MRDTALPLLIGLMIGAGILGFGAYHWFTAGNNEAPPEAPPERGLAEELPSFSMPDPEGNERHVDEWEGDILVINFWGTWCAPCREEVPLLVELQENYADQGVTVLGIALDEAEPVIRFAEDYGINYPLMVGENETLEVLEAFGSSTLGLPHTFVVDRNGKIVNFHLGLIVDEDVPPLLAPALEGQNAE
ncbi:TlpA disulfide reductase family protein [Gammaproteobacteria bacterium AB-CW1]|uniref:TlpA disulfide reductase family protein n=1 Tax=Natronospira elongata TaxID=3110268 RepID=A0AAP6MKP0_9GAMM|nr:TlpA disulfide reductase family protein [Gammaproteobacteria bacterium AB-CW1]